MCITQWHKKLRKANTVRQIKQTVAKCSLQLNIIKILDQCKVTFLHSAECLRNIDPLQNNQKCFQGGLLKQVFPCCVNVSTSVDMYKNIWLRGWLSNSADTLRASCQVAMKLDRRMFSLK